MKKSDPLYAGPKTFIQGILHFKLSDQRSVISLCLGTSDFITTQAMR